MKKFSSFFISLILFSFVKTDSVFGQIGGGGAGSVSNVDWFENVFLWLISLAGLVAVAVLIYNAFMYITASGDEGKVQKATKGITYAIVGLIIAAIAFLIVNFVITDVIDV